jgi:uncharacterized protein YecE (DUF72 family)
MAERWVDRTPDNFIFDFKAFRLFTTHATPVKVLPSDIRDEMPKRLADRSNIYGKDLPRELVDELWAAYARAIQPVKDAGKLGAVFLQFPKWFFNNHENRSYISSLPQRLPGHRLAVEFRQPGWMDERHAERTLTMLRDAGIAYTSVDEPQGTSASVPPIAETTADLSVVRFHGRRAETWDKPNVGVLDRFRYLYTESELHEWVPKIDHLANESREVHVLMNNCYSDYSVRNARQLALLLERSQTTTVSA